MSTKILSWTEITVWKLVYKGKRAHIDNGIATIRLIFEEKFIDSTRMTGIPGQLDLCLQIFKDRHTQKGVERVNS